MIGERLKMERERLGMTQEAFAGTAGAKRRTLVDWEKGVSSPTTVQLAALADAGVDVLYVVTGQRAALQVAEDMTQYVVTRPDEAALLDNYRHLCKDQQDLLKATSDALAQSAKMTTRKAG